MPGRDTAFVALALLRCRDRIGLLLDAVAEPRRSELARAVGEFDGFDEAQLRLALVDAVRREDAARELDPGVAMASRGIHKFVARREWR